MKKTNECKIRSFDALCRLSLGLPLSYVDDNFDGCARTDAFEAATEGEKEAALLCFTGVQLFKAQELMPFMQEACTLPFDNDLMTSLLPDNKVLFYDRFHLYYQSKCLVSFLTDEEFKPLFFTDYSDGLAVQYIQDAQEFRKQVLLLVCDIFRKAEISQKRFLEMSFEEQEAFCSRHYNDFHQAIQILNWRSPTQECMGQKH